MLKNWRTDISFSPKSTLKTNKKRLANRVVIFIFISFSESPTINITQKITERSFFINKKLKVHGAHTNIPPSLPPHKLLIFSVNEIFYGELYRCRGQASRAFDGETRYENKFLMDEAKGIYMIHFAFNSTQHLLRKIERWLNE